MRYERPAWVTLAITSAIALAISLMLALSRPVEMRVDGPRLLSDVAPVTGGVSDPVFIPLRPLGAASAVAGLRRSGALDGFHRYVPPVRDRSDSLDGARGSESTGKAMGHDCCR